MLLEEPEKITIKQILSWVEDDQLGIPDFQRDFIWSRPDIEDLFESILRGYYIGAFLFWSTSNRDLNPTRIYGIESSRPFHPTYIVLDGQQRISSLYYAMKSPAANLWNTKNPYLFFINVDNLLKLDQNNSDDELILVESLMQDKAEKEDLLIEKTQFRKRKFPISKIKFYHDWLDNFERYLETEEKRSSEESRQIKSKLREAFSNLWQSYQIPVIKLPKEMKLESVAKVFEKLNSTGQTLTVFDLLNARLTKHGIQLRSRLWTQALDDYEKFRLFYERNERFPVNLLSVMSLLRNKPVKKKDLLNLDHNNFQSDWQIACKAMNEAIEKINNPKDGYGVISPKWIPFAAMLPPLAALLEKTTGRRDRALCLEKIHQWWWASIHIGAYDSSTDSQMMNDMKTVQEWFDNDKKIPQTIVASKNTVYAEFMDIISSGNALYKAIICLTSLKGAKDFVNGQSLELSELDDHHIFPKSRVQEFDSETAIDSILNKTLIDRDTNRNYIKTSKPSEYIKTIMKEQNLSRDEMMDRFNSHLISKAAFVCMENDDFSGFLTARKKSIMEEFNEKLKITV